MVRLAKKYCIVLSSFLLTATMAPSQNHRMTIEIERTSLDSAINIVSTKFNTSFSYNSRLTSQIITPRLSLENASLTKVLDVLLKPHQLNYDLKKNTVLIYRKEKLARTSDRSRISGTVVDRQTKEPIPGVSVFIASTSFGASSNFDGHFEFKVSQIYPFEIVFSHVNYEPIVISIQNKEQIKKEFFIKMKENVTQLEEVVIESSNKEWKQYLKLFKQEFIGTTPNGAACKILNPWVLNFDYDGYNNIFRASSEDLLIVENKSLGYKVSHLIVLFEINQGKTRYITKPKFEKLSERNRMVERKWVKKRKSTYQGSLDHFIDALSSSRKTLKKEGFEISKVNSLEKDRIRIPFEKNKILFDQDTVSTLRFSGYVEVRYKELEEKSYLHYIDKSKKGAQKSNYEMEMTSANQQTTILEILDPSGSVIIRDGVLVNPINLVQYGYWSWKRTADILPLDYELND